MSLIKVIEEDIAAVESSQLDRWRVWDGENWAHGFKTKERAIEFAEKVGGTRVAFCKLINKKVHYVSAEKVELNE